MGLLVTRKMAICLWWCSISLSIFSACITVLGQPTAQGFISIDCGNTISYTDSTTQIPYSSDDQYIDSGTNYNIKENDAAKSVSKQDLTLRSFPIGNRNCYTLPAVQNNKYLLRATFFYGNYDGQGSVQANSPLLFDIHIGVNRWETVNISDASSSFTSEAITFAVADFISVCLVKTGSSTPFISSLEMRRLKSIMYPPVNASQSLDLYGRANFGVTKDEIIRYPDDPYDRFWPGFTDNTGWSVLSTTSKVSNYPNDFFEVPSAVMQTAVTAANGTSIGFSWKAYTGSDTASPAYFANIHLAEVVALPSGARREFDIYANAKIWYKRYTPPYLLSGGIYSPGPLSVATQYNFSLNATRNATLPPLMNAVEVYSLIAIEEQMTNLTDVDAIVAIKAQYKVKKNWMGDPCAPRKYSWDGVVCSYTASAPSIATLNLSSSGLTGEISTAFSKLQTIRILDLSNNSLTGTIPTFLANLSLLQVLNLTGNCFSGGVPDALHQRSVSGQLTLRFDVVTNTCNSPPPPGPAHPKIIVIILAVVIPVVFVILLVTLIVVVIMPRWRDRRPGPAPNLDVNAHANAHVSSLNQEVPMSTVEPKPQVQFKSEKFTTIQLDMITNNYANVLGGGGFGTVYYGRLQDGTTEVAVKVLKQASAQGFKQFLAEAENLTKVYHRNLVTLVGYCMDGDFLALVYEYMPQGTLEDHLRGQQSRIRTLSWRERLHVAVGAAQGLDYLHKGCNLPIIHRDIKSSNILLGPNLEARIADFGLCRAFENPAQSYVSTTGIAGTIGYMDPECANGKLNEKSDVFSFGVVLLEIITGEPPIVKVEGHIINRVKPKYNGGYLDGIMDKRLRGEYDQSSAWKVLNLAMRCTDSSSAGRPTMSDVVTRLNESLVLTETAYERSTNAYNPGVGTSQDSGSGYSSDFFGPSAR